LTFTYKVQAEPKGLAQAFTIGEEFIGDDSVCLILGDNIFYGQGFVEKLKRGAEIEKGGMVFGYYVKNPEEFGGSGFATAGLVIGYICVIIWLITMLFLGGTFFALLLNS
jgi:glucose-1-phosphate thymidylyltransferase